MLPSIKLASDEDYTPFIENKDFEANESERISSTQISTETTKLDDV